MHQVNKKYFKCIDTEKKAYFLGLLYADGNIWHNYLKISLQEKDIEILKMFKQGIEFSGPIRLIKKQKISHSNNFIITIGCKEIVQDLIKLGCGPRKSLILKFPSPEQVPDHLIHHFIRGYFDGDGCISLKKRLATWHLHFNLAGTYDMLSSIMYIFKQKLNIKITQINKIKSTEIYQLNITRKKISIKLKIFYTMMLLYVSRRKRNKFFVNIENKIEGVFSSIYKNICYRPPTRGRKGYWRASYYDGNIRKEKSNFKTEEEALAFLQNISL